MATDTWSITFFVPGIAKPAGSKRAFFNKHTGKAAIVDACKTSGDWKGDVKAFAHTEMIGKGPPRTGPLHLFVGFILPRPKSHYGTGKNAGVLKPSAPTWHTSKPDATKLLRCIEDAMTGIVWTDDAVIAKQEVFKGYGSQIGAKVTVTELF